MELQIPKLCRGSYFPQFLEPQRTAEKALAAVIQEADVHGVSTRSVDDLVKEHGHERRVKKRGQSAVRQARRARQRLPGVSRRGQLTIPVDRRDLRENTRGRSPRERGRDDGHGGQHRLATPSFAQDTAKYAHEQWRVVPDQLRGKFAKVGSLMDGAAREVLATMDFPKVHWLQIHSTNPLERLDAEIERRTNVVVVIPNDRAIMRPVSAILLEQRDEWAL